MTIPGTEGNGRQKHHQRSRRGDSRRAVRGNLSTCQSWMQAGSGQRRNASTSPHPTFTSASDFHYPCPAVNRGSVPRGQPLGGREQGRETREDVCWAIEKKMSTRTNCWVTVFMFNTFLFHDGFFYIVVLSSFI